MGAEYAVVGRVRKPHGLHGELVVELYTDEPDAVFAAGRRVFTGDSDARPTGAETTITRGRPFKDTWLVTLKGTGDRDAAELLRGIYLLQPSSDLPPPTPDQHYIHDLIGMSVSLPNGDPVGTVSGTSRLPQGLLLDVATPRGVSSVPFVDAIVIAVDRDARAITIDPPEGLLEL